MTTIQKYRVAMYSPGMVGFGHIRRNASLAQGLRQSTVHPAIMMIAEARQAAALPMPEGVDCVTLPALCKEDNGEIRPRFLDVSDKDLIGLRSKVISKAIKAFKPDVLIVDHLPLGAGQELARTLKHVRKRVNMRCVLGVRDVLQDPETVRRSWANQANLDVIRDYFDAVWIYGDPTVFDPVREYNLPDHIAVKVSYTGYLDQRPRLAFSKNQASEVMTSLPAGRIALCVVGGGHDGAELADAFVRADLPADCSGVVVTGPYMSKKMRQHLRRLAETRPRLKLLDFIADSASLIDRADRVIGMGGYNTMCEVLSFEKHALIVPRVNPKPEQWIRAQRMRDLGLVHVLHPDRLNPMALTEWLARDLGPRPASRSRIDFSGLDRVPVLLAELLENSANAWTATVPVAAGELAEARLLNWILVTGGLASQQLPLQELMGVC